MTARRAATISLSALAVALGAAAIARTLAEGVGGGLGLLLGGVLLLSGVVRLWAAR